MIRIVVALLLSLFVAGPGYAQSCATKAMGKDGKALVGAAKASFLKKCCEDSAVGKDGKALAGAAKKSYVDKCMKS
jgi:hypothetical protein